MRVGQLPHLINVKLSQVGPSDFGEAGGGHIQIWDGPSPGKVS
jgi:hypothetical protein